MWGKGNQGPYGYGKGNGKGPRAPPFYGGGGGYGPRPRPTDGFASMTQEMDSFMDHLGALGEMSRLGALAAGQQPGAPPAAPTALASAAPTPGGGSEPVAPAAELASALGQVPQGNDGKRAKQDTRGRLGKKAA